MKDKDKDENPQRALDSLRDAYIEYKNISGRCKTEMKARNLTSVVQKLDEKPKNK